MSRDRDFIPTLCCRCGAELARGSIMSKYNHDQICFPCKEDEKRLPSYGRANLADIAAVRNGELNFPGLGLSPTDHSLLAEMRRARKTT